MERERMLTRSQKYAEKIYEQLEQLAREWKEKEQRQKYGSMAHRLPILIHTAGLAQALAFVQARGSEEQKRLLEHIAAVLGKGSAEKLLEESRKADLTDYMRLTRQVLEALVWYKRFAQSVLGVAPGEDGGGAE